MGVVISITNQKGGVGKTVTVSSLASALTAQGKKVLTVNLDPQRNLDMVAGRGVAIARDDTVSKSILSVLKGECTLKEAVVPTNLGDLARASSILSQWTGRQLATREEFRTMPKDELFALMEKRYADGWGADDASVLRSEIDRVKDEYDYVLIDTNPSLTLLTLNGLMASDYVLVPAFTEAASRDAIKELWDTIENIKYYNPDKDLQIAGILITKYMPRAKVARKYIRTYERMAEQMGTILFEHKIRQTVSVSEYMTNQEDLLRYDPDGIASRDYLLFVEEFKKRIEELEAKKHG